ncbi:MAG: hypothetical protein FWD68_05570 [Alphaproteobacteria bacterium]|nr:hypothetical protein [Alphaproteobacteria bacterium]
MKLGTGDIEVAKKAATKKAAAKKAAPKKSGTKKLVRKEYTADDVKQLKQHSKDRTPVSKLAKLMKRTEGSLRQKARSLGIGLGHQR